MTVLLLTMLLLLSVGLGALTVAICRVTRLSLAETVTPEWLERFSVAQYAPMSELLAVDDFRFVARQPGFDGKLYRKFRRERLATFRSYLRCMVIDFNRLHALARVMIAQSATDQSNLVARLVKMRVRFGVNVLAAECACSLWYWGVPAALVAQRSLLVLQEFSAEVQMLSGARPVPQF